MSLPRPHQMQHYYHIPMPLPPAPPRHATGHGTSSAFSSCANPDEDWTKISDLAERRRIQNRIAQRNYRKKLKRRLEDLERRAGSPSTSPPPSATTTDKTAVHTAETTSRSQKRSPAQSRRMPSPKVLPSQYAPASYPEQVTFTQDLHRDASRSPPLFAPYQSYGSAEEPYGVYPPTQFYRPPPPPPVMERPAEAYETMHQIPVTLPSLNHFNEATRRDAPYDYAPYTAYHQTSLPPPPPPMTTTLTHGYEDDTAASNADGRASSSMSPALWAQT